jgi:hypothetical protein
MGLGEGLQDLCLFQPLEKQVQASTTEDKKLMLMSGNKRPNT